MTTAANSQNAPSGASSNVSSPAGISLAGVQAALFRTEAVLFIYDSKSEMLEFDGFLNKRMRPDEHCYFAPRYPLQELRT